MWHFTHFYQLLYMFVSFLVSLFVVALLFDLLLPPHLSFWLEAIIFVATFFGSVVLLEKCFSWLPTFIYIRLTLQTKVSSADAKKLSFLFDGSLDGKWYPSLDIRELSSKSRREALFQFAQKVINERAKQAK